MGLEKVRALLFKDLGGPSLTPTRLWGARPLFVIVAIAMFAVLLVDRAWIQYPVAAPSPMPPPSPEPIHFAIDDVDLGPRISLTRYVPDFDLYARAAIESSDGKLYLAYYPNRPPSTWGFTGGEASRIGILDRGRITPIDLPGDGPAQSMDPGLVELVGLKDGMPVVLVNNEKAPREYVMTPGGPRPLPGLPTFSQAFHPCVSFDSGTACEEDIDRRSAVLLDIPGIQKVLIRGAIFMVDRSGLGPGGAQMKWQIPDRGDVYLEGGGRHRLLILESHQAQDAAELLEVYAP